MANMNAIECPICLEIPAAEIFQCKNGHSLCHICISRVRECPQCRAPYAQGCVRNIALETLLDTLEFNCSDHMKGCKQRLNRKDFPDHQLNCSFNSQSVLICRPFNYECNYIANPRNVPTTVRHLVENHGFLFSSRKTVELEVHLCRFKETIGRLRTERRINSENSREYIWNPIVVSQGSGSLEDAKATFLLFCSIPLGKDDFVLSWHCYRLGAQVEESVYEVEFSVKTAKTVEFFDLSWKVPVLGLQRLKNGVATNPLNVQVKSLLSGYMSRSSEDTLIVQISIKSVGRLPQPRSRTRKPPSILKVLTFIWGICPSSFPGRIVEDTNNETSATTRTRARRVHHAEIPVVPGTSIFSRYENGDSTLLAYFLLIVIVVLLLYFWIFSPECPRCPECQICPEQETEPSLYNWSIRAWERFVQVLIHVFQTVYSGLCIFLSS